jgi:hypothetical protein
MYVVIIDVFGIIGGGCAGDCGPLNVELDCLC